MIEGMTIINKNFQQQFQSPAGDEIIMIGLQNKQGIFLKDFLQKTDSLTQFLTKLEPILKVYSITNSNIIFFLDSQINARPLVHIAKPELYATDSVFLFQSKEYRNLLVSKDGKTIAVAAFNKRYLTAKQKRLLLSEINKKIEELGFDKSHLVSKIKAEIVLFDEVKKTAVIADRR